MLPESDSIRKREVAMTALKNGGAARDCLGSTCMKWTASGELSELDLHRVMERLARVDHNLAEVDTKAQAG
jgi:hypothetical protein